MRNTSLYSFFIEYKLFLLVLFLLFVTVVVLQVNYNKNAMDDFTVDEYFTISTIHPNIDPPNTVYRALNGPRVFTYAFYPGAMVGMIGHMGGNIYEDGWDYPGHNYFVKNYKLSSSSLHKNMKDPNLRYFHYYLKLQSILFMFLSFIPLLFLLWKRKYFVAVIMMATLIGVNFLFLEERSVFYIEPLMLSMFNILIWLYLYIYDKKKLSWFWIIISSFLFALTISLKFSCLFIIGLIGVLIVSKFKGLEKRITAVVFLFLLSSLFFCIINWEIFHSKEVFNAFVHDYFSNFWQYATGNRRALSANYRFANFKGVVMELFTSLGGLLFLFPIILLGGLKNASNSEKLKWGSFIFIILLSIWFIIKQKVYIDRNILPFLPAIVLITGVMLDKIVKQDTIARMLHSGRRKYIGIVLLITIIFLPILVHSKDYFKTILPNAQRNINYTLANIENAKDRRLVQVDYKSEIGNEFLSIENIPSAPETTRGNFDDFVKENLERFESTDVVVVSEIKNNKQLTNYLLPKIFNTNKQFSNYFIFYNVETEIEKKVIGNFKNKDGFLLKKPEKIREDLILKQIKITKEKTGFIIHFKLNFSGKNISDIIGCRFYFHAKPNADDIQKLPMERREHGFEGWDFTVSSKNLTQYGSEIYISQSFSPTIDQYKSFTFGIFRGCMKSKEFKVENIDLK